MFFKLILLMFTCTYTRLSPPVLLSESKNSTTHGDLKMSTKQFMTKDEAIKHAKAQSIILESGFEAMMEVLNFTPEQTKRVL